MDYCKDCKTQECEYIEVNKFFQYISECLNKNFKICECPDKAKLDYTCDMVWTDNITKENIYVEIKEVKYGFGNEKNKNIAEDKGQINYAKLIYEVIGQSGIDKEMELNDFQVTVPRAQIGPKEFGSFCDKFKCFIKDNTFEGDSYTFVYERDSSDIKILFSRKTDEIRQKFEDVLLFAYDAEDNNTLSSIFEKMTDVGALKEQIMYNLKNTSQKKFPKEADRKILLNILKLPIGIDNFFNFNIKYVIGNLISESYESDSYANESYLLYFCDDYDDVTKIDDRVLIEENGRVLFIIPLISEWLQETIVYHLSE